jgi:hypothetical protein
MTAARVTTEPSMGRGIKLVLVFAAYARSAAAAGPVVTIASPAAGAVLGDSFPVSGTLQSIYTIASVQAQVQGPAQNLTFSSFGYSGTVDVSPVPIGPMTLTITATDSLNGSGSASVSLVHDHPPTVSVAVQNGFVARPNIRLQATCSDPDMYGCASISVSLGGAVIASTNTASLDTTVSLSQYDGKAVTLVFTATDTQGMTATLSRAGYVGVSSTLTEVAHGDGPILDFDATRLLFATDTSLVIRPRSGGVDTIIASGTFERAYLTSRGAIWPGAEWRNGIALVNAATRDLVAAGDYAAWTTGGYSGPANTSAAFLRDVGNDTTTQVASGGMLAESPSVASNGDVVFTWVPGYIPQIPNPGYERILRYRAGVLATFGSCVRCDLALTDGVNVAYQQRTLAPVRNRTYVATANGEIVLDDLTKCTSGALGGPMPSYAVAGGWTAFTKCPTGIATVFTRSPSGTIAQASVLNQDTYVDALSDTGDVIYGGASGARYLGRAGGGAPAMFTDNSNGRAAYRGAVWYVVLGQLLLRYGPGRASTGGTDGGVVDGSAMDASTPDASVVDALPVDALVADATEGDVVFADASASADDGSEAASSLLDGRGPAGDASAVTGGNAVNGAGLPGGGNRGSGCRMAPGRGTDPLSIVLGLGLAVVALARRLAFA